MSLSEDGGGGRGAAGGAGGELSRGCRGGRGDGQGHGAGLFLHPLDAAQSHISTGCISAIIRKLYLPMFVVFLCTALCYYIAWAFCQSKVIKKAIEILCTL